MLAVVEANDLHSGNTFDEFPQNSGTRRPAQAYYLQNRYENT